MPVFEVGSKVYVCDPTMSPAMSGEACAGLGADQVAASRPADPCHDQEDRDRAGIHEEASHPLHGKALPAVRVALVRVSFRSLNPANRLHSSLTMGAESPTVLTSLGQISGSSGRESSSARVALLQSSGRSVAAIQPFGRFAPARKGVRGEPGPGVARGAEGS